MALEDPTLVNLVVVTLYSFVAIQPWIELSTITYNCIHNPSMFVWPLFREFCELNKTQN